MFSMTIIEDRLGNALPEESKIRVDGLDVSATTGFTRLNRQLRNPLATVKYRAVGNVNTANAGSIIDGKGYLVRDRLLLSEQTTATENGVYWVASLAPTVLTRLTSLDVIPSYRVRVRAGNTQANSQWLKETANSFVAAADIGDSYLEVDIDDYYLEADTGDDLPSFERAQDALDDGGTITFNRRIDYTFSGKIVVKKKISLKGHSTLGTNSATRLMFNGSHGIHAVYGAGNDPSFPDAKGGWSRFEGLWLSYTGSFMESSDYHGFFLETPAIITECTVSAFPGHGVHAVADVNAIPPSGANLLRLMFLRIYQTGLSGVYMALGDANAGICVGIDVTGCGQRKFDCVRAQFVLHFSNESDSPISITPGQHVFADTKYGMYYIAVSGGIVPASGRLDVTVEAYDRSLSPGWTPIGAGTQYGYGTEYNEPASNTITTQVFPAALPSGVIIAHGVPSTLATLGDAHGIWDDSQLGNTWIGCHATGSGCRHYLALKDGGGAVFEGCYTEIGNFGEVSPPNMRLGGLWGDPPGVPSSGLGRNTSGLVLSTTLWEPGGTAGLTVRRGRSGTNEIDEFQTIADPQGYKFQQTAPTGPLANTYAWQHQGAGPYTPLALTQPAHARNRGHAVMQRGVILGKPPIRLSAGTALPTQSLAEDVWIIGDTFFVTPPPASGQPWMYACIARTHVSGSTYDLAWIPMVNRP